MPNILELLKYQQLLILSVEEIKNTPCPACQLKQCSVSAWFGDYQNVPGKLAHSEVLI